MQLIGSRFFVHAQSMHRLVLFLRFCVLFASSRSSQPINQSKTRGLVVGDEIPCFAHGVLVDAGRLRDDRLAVLVAKALTIVTGGGSGALLCTTHRL